MLVPVKITYIQPVESVTFRNGTEHRSQNMWILYDNTTPEGENEKWNTIVTLWDEHIDEFVQSGSKEEDYIMVNLTPCYSKREWQGRTIYNRDLRISISGLASST